MAYSGPAIRRDSPKKSTQNAGKTVYENGRNVTRNENGYVVRSKKVDKGDTRAPSADVSASGSRDSYGGSSYDKQYLSDNELAGIDELRRLASSGAMSWDEANWEANRIRSQYGYSGGSDGSHFNPTDYTTYMSKDFGSRSGGAGNSTSGSPALSGSMMNVDWQAMINDAVSRGDYVSAAIYEQNRNNKINSPTYTGSQKPTNLYAQYLPGIQTGYGDRPSYDSAYGDDIDSLLQQILDSNYSDFQQGSDYRYLYDKYSSRGQEAMQDVLGQLAARTGGYASSYATNAAGQAYNDYMTTLEDAARAMYQDQLNQQLQNLGVLTDAENTNYNRYLNELDQWNTDRNFAYNQYLDNRNWEYELGRDAVEDQRYEDETEYSQALLQAETLASFGDFSGYKALGYSDAQIQQMQAAYRSQLASNSSKRSSASSGSSSGSSKPRLTAAQTLDALENGLRSQQVLDAYEYYYGEPFQESGESDNSSSGSGMSPDHYRAFGSSISAQLGSGKENAAIANIDSRWDELNDEQKAGIQNLLKKYGYQYNAS